MARPIKETPILFGEDARRFEARIKEKRHISDEERARMDEAYRIGMEMMRRGEKIKCGNTYKEFKSYIEHIWTNNDDVLKELA